MTNSSIWPIDRILSGATTSCQSGPGSDGNKVVLRIPQSSQSTESSPSDYLVSYAGHSLVGSYLSAEKQSVFKLTYNDVAVQHINIVVTWTLPRKNKYLLDVLNYLYECA